MNRKPTRKVKRRTGQVNLTKGKARIKSGPSKQQLKAAARQLNRTKTRRYILYGIGCIILMQLVKYIVYNFIYVGDETPGGIAFFSCHIFANWFDGGEFGSFCRCCHRIFT